MQDLKLLVQSRFPLLAVETFEEERLEALLARVGSELGLPIWTWSVARGLARRGGEALDADTTRPETLLRRLIAGKTPGIYVLRDFHPFLAEPVIVRLLRELGQAEVGRSMTLVLCSPALELPVELRRLTARYHLELPGEDEIRMAVVETFRSLQRLSKLRYALAEDELRELARALRGLTLPEIRRAIARCALEDSRLDADDIACVLAAKREQVEMSGILEFVPIDAETAALGGLVRLREWLARARLGFGERARELGLAPPRGVLLTGVQGCGKSLAAKSIARDWQLPLVRLDPGRLFDKYVGESERNLREALRSAEAIAPVVLWIDEIEKVFATGGSSEADAGLSRRLFGSFLTWIQERKHAVFLAATANEIGALPPELLRKGRFDEIFFVDLPNAEERAQILEIHLRARRQDPAVFDFASLTAASDGFSGAELEQAVVTALYGMLAENAEALTTERLAAELARTSPLSWTHRERVERLRAQARDRFVFAN